MRTWLTSRTTTARTLTMMVRFSGRSVPRHFSGFNDGDVDLIQAERNQAITKASAAKRVLQCGSGRVISAHSVNASPGRRGGRTNVNSVRRCPVWIERGHGPE